MAVVWSFFEWFQPWEFVVSRPISAVVPTALFCRSRTKSSFSMQRWGICAAAIFATMLAGGSAHPVYAQLKVIGPVDPLTSFPTYVQDASNVQVMPCNRVEQDPAEPGVNAPPCPGLEVVSFEEPFVESNIAEFTYYRAEANMDGPDGSRYRLRIEVQGGILPPATINNAVRLRLRNLTETGTYTVIHPFGTLPVEVGPPDGTGRIDDVDMELPGGVLASAPNFAPAVNGNVHCFWENGTSALVTAVQPGTGLPYPAGAFLGDSITPGPLVAKPACPGQTNAGPTGPYVAGQLAFTVIFPSGVRVETNAFTVEAQRFVGVGLVVQRSTYQRSANGRVTRVDAWANSVPGSVLIVNGDGITDQQMVENTAKEGEFYIRTRTLPAGSPPPAMINISGTTAIVNDAVDITLARFDTASGDLTVSARSSDVYDDPGTGRPVLTAYDANGSTLLGELVYPRGNNAVGTLVVATPGGTPPEKVVVKSSKGGMLTLPVSTTGADLVGVGQ